MTASAADKARSSRETPENRRHSLIQATMRAIAKFGYAGTTIATICAEAKISRGLINHHFQSKEELIHQSYKTLCDEWESQTHGMLQDSYQQPEDKLRSMIHLSFHPRLFKQEYLGIWIGFWSIIGKSPALKKINRAMYGLDRSTYQQIFAEIADQRGISIDTRNAAITLIALTDGLWLDWCLDPKGFSQQEAEAACLDVARRLITAP